MSLARNPPPMTLADFLAWEERQELRHEFDGFAPVAMTGGTRAHETISVNLLAALVGRLRGGPCRAYGSNLKIEVAGRIRYPDAFVTCGEPGAPGDTVERSPVVVFEVLSAGTQTVDRTDKAREYRETPSIQRYVMLEQVRVAATVYAREGSAWTVSLAFRGDVLPMPEIGVELPLDELYAGLDLGEPPAA
jgi:Uma2 family endonuclease